MSVVGESVFAVSGFSSSRPCRSPSLEDRVDPAEMGKNTLFNLWEKN
jgi:hypothetical protein